jgi:ATP-dependent exoDNAse (exonuclease V) alpha subunit
VVDEASMLDLLLTNHLLKAVRPGTHVLFVGISISCPRWCRRCCRNLITVVSPQSPLEHYLRQAAD